MKVITFKPNIQLLQKTSSVFQDSDITYSDANVSYNSSTVNYGGLGYSRRPGPSNVSVSGAVPHMQVLLYPTSTPVDRVIQAGQPLGPGFFLYIPYTTSSTISI